jgi:hypothetical protein
MTVPGLEAIFDYLALLIAERGPDQPFLLRQIQPAILYKFPGFTFAAYGLSGLKEFLAAGERARYFTLINTGDVHTAYLAPGARHRATPPTTAPTMLTPTGQLRQIRWMGEVLDLLLNAERADQIVEAAQGADVLSPAFDEYLAAQERTAELYPVRGKTRRLRAFLATWREKGQTQAMAEWQTSRAVLRTPVVPAVTDAPRAASFILALMQGRLVIQETPLEALNNTFFGVIHFLRRQLTRQRAWDWVAGLDILEADARAIPRPMAPARRGLFGGRGAGSMPEVEPLDETEIEAIAARLLREAGVRSTQEETAIWRGYLAAETPEAAYRYLVERPALVQDDQLITWLDDQIAWHVAAGDQAAVRAVASRAALVIAARQLGLNEVRGQMDEVRKIDAAILNSARLLGLVLGYLKPDTPAPAYLAQHREMFEDESIGALLDEQLIKAAGQGDVARYRITSERVNLWHNVAELGAENGMKQHERFRASPRDDRTLRREMGLLLLQQGGDVEARRDILERFPDVATPEGLAMANATLDMLSFRQLDNEEYQRHFEIKRLIERCLELGIDRALAELK